MDEDHGKCRPDELPGQEASAAVKYCTAMEYTVSYCKPNC